MPPTASEAERGAKRKRQRSPKPSTLEQIPSNHREQIESAVEDLSVA